MSANIIDAKLLSKMFLSGAKTLESKKEYINELNVFPVPDGDTGTNMTMTIMSAAGEVSKIEDITMQSLCKAISSGSLRGARGNSGVILSQLLRGFTKVVCDYDELDVAIISAGFDKAVETAYKAVIKPKEGTILTVAKGMADKATELFENGEDDVDVFFKTVIDYGNEVLSKTPDMLPVLKEAGVVDSGGQGLMTVLEGAYAAFLGKGMEFSMDAPTAKAASEVRKLNTEVVAEADIKFGYCTEFIILLNGKEFTDKMEKDFKEYLMSIGDSLVVVADDELVKVHVHTNDPGFAIQRALKYGQLSNLKIDNMRLEHHEKVIKMNEKEAVKQLGEKKAAELSSSASDASDSVEAKPVNVSEERKAVGFISVSVGDGLSDIFKNLGVDYLIEGGQTMNPSTEDMLNAIASINADTIFILPNNKNIILAANQARDLTEDKKIEVVPSKTVPQGISALIAYVPDFSVDENIAAMEEAISAVKTGQLTYAVRNTTIEGKEIHEGDYMSVGDEGILSNGKDLDTVFMEMMDALVGKTTELISIYYGEDVKEEDAESLKSKLEEKYPKCDIDLEKGGQPVYYYIVSAEG